MKKDNIPEQLPDVLYVVTRERTRAGKPPMKIKPVEYVVDGITGDKIMVVASVYPRTNGLQRKFPLPYCYLTAEEALHEVQSVVVKESAYENSRISRIKRRLSNAEQLTKKMLVPEVLKTDSNTLHELYEWVDHEGEIHQTQDRPNSCETPLPIRKIKAGL